MGSVKDLKVLQKATDSELGLGRFIFSDRYSVFDWGEMPDLITDKGKAIAILAAYFFEKLEEAGISTHYVGVVENGLVKKLKDATQPVDELEVRLLNVIKPEIKNDRYDYSQYAHAGGGFLIPLEIIYRNSLPEGSSVFKRIATGELMPSDMGLDQPPAAGKKLKTPFMDVSTKLEITDRYISWAEAQEISGLNEIKITALKKMAATVNVMISDEFKQIGLENEDGKIECGFDLDRTIMLVDVLGTLDECRFTYQGLPVSKEIARIYYRDSPWHKAVEEAKRADRLNWKEICASKPDPLPKGLSAAIQNIYCACTNMITKREWFKDIPPLSQVLKDVSREYGK
jgi:phosphoribosylaminoimidazole-succinocarboxamide synthase